MQLMKAANLAGVEVPGKLSIAGFDNLQAGEVFDIPLTTIQQNFYEMGASAAQLVLEMISKKENGNFAVPKLIQDTKLIVRQSTSAPQ
ncbi:substrate-binding domain-containing protein [Paenibacillus sp. FSL H7-0716]|nr:substrate-binding domain-containing protein [Paenibacillus odorifer]